jgi:hypothetical protein
MFWSSFCSAKALIGRCSTRREPSPDENVQAWPQIKSGCSTPKRTWKFALTDTSESSSDPRTSPSERLTLKHVAEGELFEREMDWLAEQRLKACVLLEERGNRLKLTQAGKDTLRRLRLARPKRAPAEMLTVDAWGAVLSSDLSESRVAYYGQGEPAEPD